MALHRRVCAGCTEQVPERLGTVYSWFKNFEPSLPKSAPSVGRCAQSGSRATIGTAVRVRQEFSERRASPRVDVAGAGFQHRHQSRPLRVVRHTCRACAILFVRHVRRRHHRNDRAVQGSRSPSSPMISAQALEQTSARVRKKERSAFQDATRSSLMHTDWTLKTRMSQCLWTRCLGIIGVRGTCRLGNWHPTLSSATAMPSTPQDCVRCETDLKFAVQLSTRRPLRVTLFGSLDFSSLCLRQSEFAQLVLQLGGRGPRQDHRVFPLVRRI